jgi:hypothetical protein
MSAATARPRFNRCQLLPSIAPNFVPQPPFPLTRLRAGLIAGAMRRPVGNVLILSILFVTGFFPACRTATPPSMSQFQQDSTGLFLSVTKSFGVVHAYYVGSDDQWSYFDCRGDSPRYRKVPTSSMSLRRMFPFRQGIPYRIELSDFGYEKNGAHH